MRLLQTGVGREIYFRGNRDKEVIVLDARASIDEAKKALVALPLVKAGFIDFDYIPLKPHPIFARLFA